MTGFQGLVLRRFNGHDQMAREYVADLGRASYFYRTKPGIAINGLKRYVWWIPELFVIENGQVVDIAWKSSLMREKGTY